MDNIEAVKANAEIVIKTFAQNNDVSLNYDKESVIWIDGYIERNRHNWDESAAGRLSERFRLFSRRMYSPQLRRRLGDDRKRTRHRFF